MMKYFVVLKVSQNENFWTQGVHATSFTLLLSGHGVYVKNEQDLGTGVWSREVVGYLQKGKNIKPDSCTF